MTTLDMLRRLVAVFLSVASFSAGATLLYGGAIQGNTVYAGVGLLGLTGGVVGFRVLTRGLY